MAHKKIDDIFNKFAPKTDGQDLYWDALMDKKVRYLACSGPSGVGKTVQACRYAAKALQQGNYHKIILCTSITTIEGEEIGFLPGDAGEKMAEHAIRMTQHLDKFLPRSASRPEVEIVPLAYIRGRDFFDSVVICDETQNYSTELLKTIFTRCCQNSKLILCGDIEQADKYQPDDTDFERVCEVLTGHNAFEWVQLTEDDIVRSPHIAGILERFKRI